MKMILVIAVGAAMTSATFAQNFSAPLRPARQATTPPFNQRNVREGGFQRAARTGNPMQALNPLAPREYGTGAAFVEDRGNDPFFRPRDASREHPIALRLFAFEF